MRLPAGWSAILVIFLLIAVVIVGSVVSAL